MAGELVLVAFVWGMIAFAVAIDAVRRDVHSGFWAGLTFLTGVFGGALYGLVVLTTGAQSDEEAFEDETGPEIVRVCPDCSSRNGGSQNYCGECGVELGPEDEHPLGRRLETGSRWYCSNCKSRVGREENTCSSCGALL